jgi:hypothetical protein
MNLQFLIENQSYRTASLLDTSQFMDYCKKAGLNINKENLEFYEKHKIFYPFTRVKIPEVKRKIELLEEGKKFRYIGVLKKGERWKGAIRREQASFRFEPDYVDSYYTEGLLWEPRNRKHLSWKNFETKDYQKKYENYYSRFQIFHLYMINTSMSISISYQYLLSKNFNSQEFAQYNKKDALNQIAYLKENFNRFNSISYLCQCISNQYYPLTQSDQRKISITTTGINWDWHNFRRSWNAEDFATKLNLSDDNIKSFHQLLSTQAAYIDPISSWHDLTVFISIEKRKYLKNEALLAEYLYAMEMMIRLFYTDARKKDLNAPYYSNLTDIPYNHGVKNENDSLKYLEYITNRYHLNPQPKLILVCEGNGEEEQFARFINKGFGYDLSALGIEIMNLKGVGNFEGDKFDRPYGALKRFIDYHHNRSTIVFVILDNEGRVLKTRDKLINAMSIFDKNRFVTYKEYFTIWNISFEYDNFNDLEISEALNAIPGHAYDFKMHEIADTRKRIEAQKKHDLLSELYQEKTGYGLNKPELAKILIDGILASESQNKKQVPLISVLRRVIDIASWNSLPNSIEERENLYAFWFSKDNRKRIERFFK